jgi:hypothetical protein
VRQARSTHALHPGLLASARVRAAVRLWSPAHSRVLVTAGMVVAHRAGGVPTSARSTPRRFDADWSMVVCLLHLPASTAVLGWVRATAINGIEGHPTALKGKALTSVFAVSAGQGLVCGNVETEVVFQLPSTALNGVKPQVNDVEAVTSLPRPPPRPLLDRGSSHPQRPGQPARCRRPRSASA